MASVTIPCTNTIIPSKADLVNALVTVAMQPAMLVVEAAQAATQSLREQLLSSAANIRAILDGIRSTLGSFPISLSNPLFENIGIPEIEWERIGTAIVQEFHIYVQTKMLELIADLIPISFSVNVLGIAIDIRDLISGNLAQSIKDTVRGAADSFFNMLPNVYRMFGGLYGVDTLEGKAEAVVSYIMNKVSEFATNTLHAALGVLIDTFNEIWEGLGLPALAALLTFDVEAAIGAIISSWTGTYQDLISALESLSIFGFSLPSIIGGQIQESVVMAERTINRLIEAARDFSVQWPRKILTDWMDTVTSFFEAIGLGALIDWITFDFCDFLGLIGIPLTINY